MYLSVPFNKTKQISINFYLFLFLADNIDFWFLCFIICFLLSSFHFKFDTYLQRKKIKFEVFGILKLEIIYLEIMEKFNWVRISKICEKNRLSASFQFHICRRSWSRRFISYQKVSTYSLEVFYMNFMLETHIGISINRSFSESSGEWILTLNVHE